MVATIRVEVKMDAPEFSGIEITHVDRVEIAMSPRYWEFATVHRREIDRHFACFQKTRPVWNGRVLLLERYFIRDGVLHGLCFETDYASLIAWIDWNFPDRTVYNFFGAAAMRAADGAYLIGEMGQHTAGAGQLSFPCGTPEPSDLDANGSFDLTRSLSRELHEETGIDIDELDPEPGWILVRDRCYLALMRQLVSRESARGLQRRVKAHLASEQCPEFSDICMVRGSAELDARMPPFVAAFLREQWRDDVPRICTTMTPPIA